MEMKIGNGTASAAIGNVVDAFTEGMDHRRSTDRPVWRLVGILMDVILIIGFAFMVRAYKTLSELQETMTEQRTTQTIMMQTVVSLQRTQVELVSQVQFLKEWKAEVSGNNFTVNDGKIVWQEIASIRECMAKIAISDPPTWFTQKVDKLEDRITALERSKTAP